MNDEHARKTTGKPPFYGPMDKEAVSNAMDGWRIEFGTPNL